ncbi:MAG: lysyl oxidase family protein [Actinomycetota bacterium]|nr:lysyl oxidase family protein [Actinomycetota bacterium]
MGVNLVPIVRNFTIEPRREADPHSIQDGCIEPGVHRLLRFDFLSHNKGDADLVVGDPRQHPEWFVESASHGHYHLKDFNEFVLFDMAGNAVRGYKQAFCLEDSEPHSPHAGPTRQFTSCNTNQGISAGWADLYYASLPCQFVVIDDVPDGDYVLRSTTNLNRIFPEDTYDDNTIHTRLRIQGDSVTVVADGDWSGVNDNWRPLGGFFPAAAPLASVARTTNNLDVFVCGNDGRVYTSWWFTGADWSGVNDNWRSLGGFFPAGAPVSAVARTGDNLDLFICGNDGRVYTSWWFAGADWSGVNDNWRPLGGFFPAGAPVSAVARTGNNLDLFVVGNDGRVYTSWWFAGGDWSGVNDNWRPLGGFFPAGAPVTAVSRGPGQLDLFVTGNDGRVYTSWWTDGADWSGVNDNWRPLGGFFPAGARVSAVARTQNNLDLFICGNDGRVYTSWWFAGADWSGVNDNWRSIGGFFPAGARLSALARTPDNLDVFVTGNDGRVYTSWWFAGADWSGVNDNWRPIGGFFPAGAPLATVARHPGHLDAWVCGNDGRVYTSWWGS